MTGQYTIDSGFSHAIGIGQNTGAAAKVSPGFSSGK